MKSNYSEHPWLKEYPVDLNKHKYLILGTHPPKPYFGCIPFYYGNKKEFWRLLEQTYNESILFDNNGVADIQKLLKWLDQKNIAITDMIQFTEKDNTFSTDSSMIVKKYNQYNQDLKKWLENSKIETIFFTSFSSGNSAFGFFKKWYKEYYNKSIPNGKTIIEKDNIEFIHINDRKIRLVMLYSPSPTARRGIPNSQPFKNWLKDNTNKNNPIDTFRKEWYQKYFKEIIN